MEYTFEIRFDETTSKFFKVELDNAPTMDIYKILFKAFDNPFQILVV